MLRTPGGFGRPSATYSSGRPARLALPPHAKHPCRPGFFTPRASWVARRGGKDMAVAATGPSAGPTWPPCCCTVLPLLCHGSLPLQARRVSERRNLDVADWVGGAGESHVARC